MGYDPLNDEKKQYSLEDFVKVAKEELESYEKTWANANDFHKATHTWDEWWTAFHRYMSW